MADADVSEFGGDTVSRVAGAIAMLAEWIVALFALISSIVFFVISFSFPTVTVDPGGLALFPRIAAVLTGVSSAALIIRMILRDGTAAHAAQTAGRFITVWRERSTSAMDIRRGIIVFSLCVLYPLAVLQIGFFLASLVFSFVLVLFYRGTLIQAALLSIVLSVCLQLFFSTLLGVYVPPGKWTGSFLEPLGL